MWPEIQIAQTEKRREIVLSGTEISERIKKNGIDNSIFSLSDLNYLSITDTNLEVIPNDISKLINIQRLILHSNKLKTCDESIFKLQKLKILDLSNNFIEVIPENIASHPEIAILNISNNSLQKFPSLANNTKLTVLDLSNNNLSAFPNICSDELTNLSEVNLHGNQIDQIPSNIDALPALKIMNISDNNIKNLPGELAECHKLKEINLKSNPISDRRLKKLIDQCRTKQILDYVRQNCPRSSEKSAPPKGKKGNKSCEKNKDLETNQTENDDEFFFSYNITVTSTNNNLKVVVDNSVKIIREHIVCCIVKNISFSETSFKKFIQLQNKLHDGVCGKRTLATIATHDLRKLGDGVIKYTTLAPKELKIKPLNKVNAITGDELVLQLQTEANNLRKEKKRSSYSGIHKYLYLIEGRPVYPCLLNEHGEVISFPPITNSDISKIEVTTTQIFLEVTSTVSQFTCKNILTDLLKEMISLFEKDLEVQQVKIFDHEEKLKVVFPSKNDLKYDASSGINVIRD